MTLSSLVMNEKVASAGNENHFMFNYIRYLRGLNIDALLLLLENEKNSLLKIIICTAFL